MALNSDAPILEDTAETHLEIVQSPFCREIRSKKYYFLQEMPTRMEDLLDSTRSCWCQQTTQAIGPDGEMVHPTDCAPGRSCYKSLFEVTNDA